MMYTPTMMVLPAHTLRGSGRVRQLPELGRTFGRRGMILMGRSFAQKGGWTNIEKSSEPDILTWRYAGGEPTLSLIEDLLSVARSHDAAWIAGIGGGSVLDAAKAVAGLIHAGRAVRDYHEGAPVETTGVPFLAVPTTAGSGSEATMVSVLTDPARNLKRSIRHPHFVPRVVVLDPDLIAGSPPSVIAHSGLDALCQAIEAYLSRHACPFTDAAALQAFAAIHASLPALYSDSSDTDAAMQMLEGSFLAGIALSSARLGVVHGLAHPIGARTQLPHGQICAMGLPLALSFNRSHCSDRMATLDAAAGGDVSTWVDGLLDRCNIPRTLPASLPIDLDDMVAEVLASGSTEANPRPVSAADAAALIQAFYRP